MRSYLRVMAFSYCLFLALSAESSSKTVFVLLPGQPGTPFTVDYLHGLRNSFQSQNKFAVNIYAEHLNLQQFPKWENEMDLLRWISTKYSGVHFDAIITVGRDSLEFVEKWRDVLWQDIPVIFSVVDETGRKEFPPGITGINFPLDYLSTVRAAIMLQPESRHLALVSGSSKADQFNRAYALRQLKPLLTRVDLIDISGLSIGETIKRLSALPEKTIVLVTGFFIDGEGQLCFATDFIPRFVKASSAPIYELTRHVFGLGTVGGVLNDYEESGEETADQAIRVLDGEPPSSIPIQQTKTAHMMFDWRQLHRWGIDESRLPKGSMVLYRRPSFWHEHKSSISTAIALILLQSLLIATLLAERSRRRAAQESERKTAELSHSVLNSVQEQVGIINKEGILLGANQSWSDFRPQKNMALMGTRIGENYLQKCQSAAGRDQSVAEAIKGIQAVLNGTLNHFSMEHSYHNSTGEQWYEMTVAPLKIAEGGAVISHVDTSEKRIAEIEAQENRRELAHISRATTMGELASSLAHELNQPLTAILSNAQAAALLLDSQPTNLTEVKEALGDIGDDGIRAGEIIHRMRALFKKEEIYFADVNLNDVVKEVVRLIHNEALIRKVNLETNLSDGLPVIRGDHVHLQQVILNLAMNALDSSSQMALGKRSVKITTDLVNSQVQLRVLDSGNGIQPERMPQIFEPFFTTKRTGMGMGLSICRTIMKEHGGRIWAESEYTKGATFYCAFPIASEQSDATSPWDKGATR